MTSDRTHDISNTPYHVRDIEALGKVLTSAAEAAFPNRGVSRYKEVHTLLLSWEDDNLGVADEIGDLGDVFRHLYGFQTEEWRIPSKRSHNSLASKILGFLDDYESKDNLLIVYYGGHGEMNDDRQCVWSCTDKSDASEVQWYGLQTMLEQAKSDVLILLDCCAAASSATGSGSGITEIIAACGFEAWAPGVGQHSFTRSLIDELRYLHRTGPFSTSLLHNKVLSRVKYWKPRFAPSANYREMRRTPIYIVISDETRPRSIEIEAQQQQPAVTVSSFSPESTLSSLSISEGVTSTPRTTSESSNTSAKEVWPDKDFNCPKVLISVALEEEQWLSPQQWADWIRSIPCLVKYANVEGAYKSDSTLLLLTIPVAIWDLVPPSRAISFIGFTRSQDLTKQHRNPVNVGSQEGLDILQKLDDLTSGSSSIEKLSTKPKDPVFGDRKRSALSLILEDDKDSSPLSPVVQPTTKESEDSATSCRSELSMSSNSTWLSLLEEKKIEARDSFEQSYSLPTSLNSDSSFRTAFEKLCEKKREHRSQRPDIRSLVDSFIPIADLAKAVHESIGDMQDLHPDDTLEALIWWISFGLIEYGCRAGAHLALLVNLMTEFNRMIPKFSSHERHFHLRFTNDKRVQNSLQNIYSLFIDTYLFMISHFKHELGRRLASKQDRANLSIAEQEIDPTRSKSLLERIKATGRQLEEARDTYDLMVNQAAQDEDRDKAGYRTAEPRSEKPELEVYDHKRGMDGTGRTKSITVPYKNSSQIPCRFIVGDSVWLNSEGYMIAGTVQDVEEEASETLYTIKGVEDITYLAWEKDLSIRIERDL